MGRSVKRFSVPESLVGQRLDQVLAALDPSLSRTLARKLIDFGGAHLNGRRVRSCSQPVAIGDRIDVYIDGLPLQPFELTPERIVFRDPYILVIDKPAGIDCQPTPSRYKGTVYAALQMLLAVPGRGRGAPSIGMVQRLDRETSGLMVFSIHQRAHKRMTEQFASRTIVKQYLALVSGRVDPPAGEFRSLLARNRASNLMKSVDKGGREAITRYRTVSGSELATLVEIDLLTGRSHQIRTHFSEAGFPLLGDSRYGGPGECNGVAVARQMLHASRLVFDHPVHGTSLEFNLTLPADLLAVAGAAGMELPQ